MPADPRISGSAKIVLALHSKPAEDACDPETASCLRHRLAMLSRACLDAHHGYRDAVLLLVDLSESLNEKVGSGGTAQTILQLSQEAVSLLAWAIDRLGDPLAIAGFHSNTRYEVRYQHIKGFSERWDDTFKARVAAMEAGWSTRMDAALRHAGHRHLLPVARPQGRRVLREIFGHRWRVLDRIERLPEQLPMLYLSLTQ